MLRRQAPFVAALVACLAHCGNGGDDANAPPHGDAGSASADAAVEATAPEPDAKERAPETGFVTSIVSFTPGACAGFGQDQLPGVVFGPPRGGGTQSGGLDVVSLGTGGTIVLSFDPIRIVDGPGPDLTVFENAFYASGDPSRPFLERAEVSISADGETWRTFPCDADAGTGCAGVTPVLSSPENGVSSTDPSVSGGDSFDLADLAATAVRYVKIRDVGRQGCAGSGGPGTNGFDLDAIAVLHAALP